MAIQVGQFYRNTRGLGDACQPGWVSVQDDSGNQICVQPASGDAGYCQPGQSVYIDTDGSPVCYANTGSVSTPRTGFVSPAPGVIATRPATNTQLIPQVENMLGVSGSGLAIGMAIVLFVMMRKR
jgi:hypothetical protein